MVAEGPELQDFCECTLIDVDRCECVSNLYVRSFKGEFWHLPLYIDFKLRILWAFAAHGIGWVGNGSSSNWSLWSLVKLRPRLKL